MARRKRTPAKKPIRRRTTRKRVAKGLSVQDALKLVAIGSAGAIVGGMAISKAPVENKMIKAGLPIVAGILLATLKKGSPEIKTAGIGLATAGGIGIAKQFAPATPMLAGYDDTITIIPIEDQELAYAGSMGIPASLNFPAELNSPVSSGSTSWKTAGNMA